MTNISKIALVTGGSRGLGKNMALKLAEKGLDVIITYHSRNDDAQNVVSEIEKLGRKAFALRLDVADSNSFQGFADKIKTALQNNFQTGKFDFLVNNAGVGAHASFGETTEW